jgi:hypothetical protein
MLLTCSFPGTAAGLARGMEDTVLTVRSGRREAPRREDLAAQRRVPPAAPMQGNNLDRDEMPVPGAGVDHAQDPGRAAHRELRTACRPALRSPSGPTGERVNSPWSPR